MQTGMGRVVGMRAEDRKPAKRVFPLLQNLDLDTVTFSQVQSVGEPISIEDMNEQELQDLVLVNLARLSVESEWTGLLEAGGAPNTGGYVSDYWYCPVSMGSASAATYTMAADKLYLIPISITADMSLEALTAYVAGAVGGSNIRIGIYNYSSTGLGGTLLAEGGTASSASTGWKIMSGMSTSASQGYYFLAIQSDAAISTYRFNISAGGGVSWNQIPFSTVEAGPEQLSFGTIRYDVAYSAGMTDLTSVTPDAYDYYQIIVEMRPA